MFQAGLLKEIKNLKKKGVSERRLKELGFEYSNPTKERVIAETLKYAKRQITWFKRDKEIKWFTPSEIEGVDASKKIPLKDIILSIKKD
jgi:tRNA dimethylallyltransferase